VNLASVLQSAHFPVSHLDASSPIQSSLKQIVGRLPPEAPAFSSHDPLTREKSTLHFCSRRPSAELGS
jgi:hypothetical protein